MKVSFLPHNNKNMTSSMKALEKAVKLPQQLMGDLLKLQNKMLKVNVAAKVQSTKIDTYA